MKNKNIYKNYIFVHTYVYIQILREAKRQAKPLQGCPETVETMVSVDLMKYMKSMNSKTKHDIHEIHETHEIYGIHGIHGIHVTDDIHEIHGIREINEILGIHQLHGCIKPMEPTTKAAGRPPKPPAGACRLAAGRQQSHSPVVACGGSGLAARSWSAAAAVPV